VRPPGSAPFVAFGVITAITAVWWALALWPLAADAPEWVFRARAVCFGTRPDGLPDASGWTALILQPVIMFGMLTFIWGSALTQAVSGAARSTRGRVLLGALAIVLLGGGGAVGLRVAGAAQPLPPVGVGPLPADYPRLDRDAPALGLLDQYGDSLTLAHLSGRSFFVTFGFAHCETVCPMVVHDVRQARRRLGAAAPPLLVITLDPWRDVPRRLGAIARMWELEEDEHVLSGSVGAVERTLDAWRVARSRDEDTGDIVHPRIVYLVDETGTIAYVTTGGVEALVDLATRL
jgi:cytochrome oxidase Cu insertion factor (SCO1/SenC/PrrC family)